MDRAAFPPLSCLWGQRSTEGPSWNPPLHPKFLFLRKEMHRACLARLVPEGGSHTIVVRPSLFPDGPHGKSLLPVPRLTKQSSQREVRRLRKQEGRQPSFCLCLGPLQPGELPGGPLGSEGSPSCTATLRPHMGKGEGCPLQNARPLHVPESSDTWRHGVPLRRTPEQKATCVIFRLKVNETGIF